jgi:bifunctional DNA-binding transcriptional regulator/antitoxin component of YhaV-PrlF toxin-antitoxin module
MLMMLKVDSKHRVTIPAKLGLTTPGEYLEALYDEDEDRFIFKRARRKENWLEVFKQCPSSMDDIPPRSRELPKKIKI